jgi:anti-sigma regulatory factor (Ser/Thr protein kinase)
VELIVSELVTNAVCAMTDPDGRPRYDDAVSGLSAVHMQLSSDRVRVVVEIWDGRREAPAPEHAGPEQESGRGLMLVEALSERWGWEVVPDWTGKVVWAELLVR